MSLVEATEVAEIVNPQSFCEVCGDWLPWCPVWVRKHPWLQEWRDRV